MDNAYIDKFVYIHIPKCAGTSMFNIFKASFGRERILRDMSYKSEARRTFGKHVPVPAEFFNRFMYADNCYEVNIRRANMNNYNVLMGHFTIHKYNYLHRPFITFLRNPIARVISEYSALSISKNRVIGPFETFVKNSANHMNWMTGGNLRRFAFVGIVERFEESILKLGKRVNKRFDRRVKSNITTKKIDLSTLTAIDIKYLKLYNRLDMKLYLDAWKKL